jgi:hypothetical protein
MGAHDEAIGDLRARLLNSKFKNCPVSVDERSDGQLTITIGAHSHYIEFGNDPGGGVIYPRRAKALRFKAKDGSIVFAKYVLAARPQHLFGEIIRQWCEKWGFEQLSAIKRIME